MTNINYNWSIDRFPIIKTVYTSSYSIISKASARLDTFSSTAIEYSSQHTRFWNLSHMRKKPLVNAHADVPSGV